MQQAIVKPFLAIRPGYLLSLHPRLCLLRIQSRDTQIAGFITVWPLVATRSLIKRITMMRTPLICLVTIHGIGFQQPPEPALGLSGYADGLHQHLSKYLPAPFLGDDPGRTRLQYGENGPIYVQSHWPPHSDNVEQGLARLGRWSAPDMRTVDTTVAPLAADDARIAHVALVYSPPEHEKAQIGAALLAGSMSLAHASHYAHIKELMHMVLHDSAAVYKRITIGTMKRSL